MIKFTKILLLFFIASTVCSCSIGPDRSWQKPKEFIKRRDTSYNKFVEGGGFDIKYSEDGKPIIRNYRELAKASHDLDYQIDSLNTKSKEFNDMAEIQKQDEKNKKNDKKKQKTLF